MTMTSDEELTNPNLMERLAPAAGDGDNTVTEGYKLRAPTDSFSSINERPVDDISLEFFYKPHTITLLLISIGAVIYSAFAR